MNLIMHSATVGLGSSTLLYVGVCTLMGLNIYVNKVFLPPSGPKLLRQPKRDVRSGGVCTGPRWETAL